MIVIPPQQQAAISPQGGDKKGTATVTAFGLRIPNEQPKKNTAKGSAADIRVIQPSRNNSPRSQLDFDIQATTSNEYSKLNHSHDAYEIQHKTQAMRDLDVLLGDTDDDDDEEESIKMTFAVDEEKESKKKSKRRRSRSKKRKSNRHSKWLFQYTSDDIDDAVEDLISPFDGITNFMTCHRYEGGDDDDDNSVVDKGELL